MIRKLKLIASALAAAMALGLVSPTILSLIGFTSTTAVARTIFYDDFEDGRYDDGMPVTWQEEGATLQIENGSLIVSGLGVPIAIPSIAPLSNVSIQTQLRILEGDYAGVAGRRVPTGNRRSYFAAAGQYLNNGVRTNDVWLGFGNSLEVIDAKDVDLDPFVEDIILQLDIIGDRITYWAWPADEPRPAAPIGSVVDHELASGEIFLWASSSGLVGNATGRAAFRYVHVMDTPEPSSSALVAVTPFLLGFWWRRRWVQLD